MQLYLTGMPGAGKSSLAGFLAQFLSIEHLDTDDMVEKAYKSSISEIFTSKGEEHFRRLETQALQKCCNSKQDFICSTGGGILESAENRAMLKSKNVIYIRKTMVQLLENIRKDIEKRPLLKGLKGETEKKLKFLLERRKAWFEQSPAITVSNQNFSMKDVPHILYAIGSKTRYFDDIQERVVHNGVHPIVFSPFGAIRLINEKARFLFTSQSVHAIYSNFLNDNNCVVLSDGESAKTIDSLKECWELLVRNSLSREEEVYGFGGGTITDLTGFAAATFKRGIPFSFIPTTLLAQVDAAIGGKNAINLEGVKNACGTFSFPNTVYVDPLITLSCEREELANGIVEGLKAALIANEDEEILKKQLENAEQILKTPTIQIMDEFVLQAIGDKMGVVQEDPYENSSRKFLNLGHTYGHVYETTHHISHGKAVALGMIKMLRKKQNKMIKHYVNFLMNLFKEDLELLDLDENEAMREKLLNDKKNNRTHVIFVDMEKPGQPYTNCVKKSDIK